MEHKRKSPPPQAAEADDTKNGPAKKKNDYDDSKSKTRAKKPKISETGAAVPALESISAFQRITTALSERKAQELAAMMKDGVMIRLLSTDSFYTALVTLREAGILSAPIYDEAEGKYVGLIDLIDLTAITLEILEGNETFKKKQRIYQQKAKKHQQVEDEVQDEDEAGMISEHLLMESLSVIQLSDFSQRDPWITVREDDSILQAATLLREAHRIAIINDTGDVTGIASQSGLMELVSEEYYELIEESGVKIEDMHLPHQVYAVSDKVTALQALEEMRDRRVSAVAVVDKDGKLVEVLSASDLVLWSEWVSGGHVLRFKHTLALENNVLDFLVDSRAQRGTTATGPIVCHKDTLLSEVTSAMLMNHVHRIFVVDKQSNKPISVVAYGDIITYLLRHKRFEGIFGSGIK